MKAHYRITLIDSKSKNTIYELRVKYQSYLIAIYFIGTHYPSKRLGRIKPSRYFEKIKDKDLYICLSSLKDMVIINKDIEVNLDQKFLRSIISRSKYHIHKIKLKEEDALDVINRFYKSLSDS